ncbi:MAG: Transcriptional regulator MraZ [Myxococcota bacterium]|nr:Transcriptional regulator MraZ [Myxococcota bacterium]
MLDPKKRVKVPSAFRELLRHQGQECACVLANKDGCLRVYPVETFQRKIVDKLNGRSQFATDVKTLRRLIIGGSNLVTLDPQGRMGIEDEKLSQAHLERDVLLVGCGEYFEIWNAADFAAWKSKVEADQTIDLDEIAAETDL